MKHDTYIELVQEFRLTSIKNDRQHARAVKIAERLMGTKLDKGAGEYLDALVILIGAYEDEHHPIDTSNVTPLDMLKHLMENNNMGISDLGRIIGSRSTASMILSGRRPISPEKSKLLEKRFCMKPGTFVTTNGHWLRPNAALRRAARNYDAAIKAGVIRTNSNRPAEVSPPGDYIRAELKARNWRQCFLAKVMNSDPITVSHILAGSKPITPTIAKQLAKAFGTSAQLWLNLERSYRGSDRHFTDAADKVERRFGGMFKRLAKK